MASFYLYTFGGEAGAKAGFAKYMRRSFGESFSVASCEELYSDILRLKDENVRGKARLVMDEKAGGLFVYNASSHETALQSFAYALKDKYELPERVPLWLIRAALDEPAALRAFGHDVYKEEVDALCSTFAREKDAKRVWKSVEQIEAFFKKLSWRKA